MPMNVIIVAIIVIVVLVVLIAFFAGGFSSLSNKLRDIFGGATTGKASDAALLDCQNFCDVAASLPTSVQGNTAYCRSSFVVDTDGNPDTAPKKVKCSGAVTDLDRSASEERRGIQPDPSWRVECPEVSCPL